MTGRDPIRLDAIQKVVRALEREKVRYIVAGGIAVVAHGYTRVTQDIDIVLALDTPNVLAAVRAVTQLGYRPNIPVPAESLAEPEMRRQWIRDKQMTVFPLFNDRPGFPPIDVFVEEPFDFGVQYQQALAFELKSGLTLPVVSLPTLLKMKQATGRPKDREDVKQLQAIWGGTENARD